MSVLRSSMNAGYRGASAKMMRFHEEAAPKRVLSDGSRIWESALGDEPYAAFL